MNKLCICGKSFHVAEWQLRTGRGKFCSKTCYYANPSPKAGFQKGHKLLEGSERGWFKKGIQAHNFLGDDVGYAALHEWVKKKLEKPGRCEHCLQPNNLELANRSHLYLRELDDWLWLCRKCHVGYDRSTGSWGVATIRFGGKL